MKQADITQTLYTMLNSIEALIHVGVDPHASQNVGINFPAVLIKEGDELIVPQGNGKAECYLQYHLFLLVANHPQNTQEISNVQNMIINKLRSNLALGNDVLGINEGISIEKGEAGIIMEAVDYYEPGYNCNFVSRKISFQLHYQHNL